MFRQARCAVRGAPSRQASFPPAPVREVAGQSAIRVPVAAVSARAQANQHAQTGPTQFKARVAAQMFHKGAVWREENQVAQLMADTVHR